MNDATFRDPMQVARRTLKGHGLSSHDQEAFLVLAALIENHAYAPADIHPELIHSSWYFRIQEVWATPPGFRAQVLETILQREYHGTEYLRACREALHAAQAAFRPDGAAFARDEVAAQAHGSGRGYD